MVWLNALTVAQDQRSLRNVALLLRQELEGLLQTGATFQSARGSHWFKGLRFLTPYHILFSALLGFWLLNQVVVWLYVVLLAFQPWLQVALANATIQATIWDDGMSPRFAKAGHDLISLLGLAFRVCGSEADHVYA